jgi:hypothetical protein
MSSKRPKKTEPDPAVQLEIARFEDDLAADMLGVPPVKPGPVKRPGKPKAMSMPKPAANGTADDKLPELHDDALNAPVSEEMHALVDEEAAEFEKRSYQVSKRNQHRREEDARSIVHDVSITALAAIKWGLLLLSYVWLVHIVSWQPWLAAESLTRIENILSHAWALIIGGLVAQVVSASKKPEIAPG